MNGIINWFKKPKKHNINQPTQQGRFNNTRARNFLPKEEIVTDDTEDSDWSSDSFESENGQSIIEQTATMDITETTVTVTPPPMFQNMDINLSLDDTDWEKAWQEVKWNDTESQNLEPDWTSDITTKFTSYGPVVVDKSETYQIPPAPTPPPVVTGFGHYQIPPAPTPPPVVTGFGSYQIPPAPTPPPVVTGFGRYQNPNGNQHEVETIDWDRLTKDWVFSSDGDQVTVDVGFNFDEHSNVDETRTESRLWDYNPELSIPLLGGNSWDIEKGSEYDNRTISSSTEEYVKVHYVSESSSDTSSEEYIMTNNVTLDDVMEGLVDDTWGEHISVDSEIEGVSEEYSSDLSEDSSEESVEFLPQSIRRDALIEVGHGSPSPYQNISEFTPEFTPDFPEYTPEYHTETDTYDSMPSLISDNSLSLEYEEDLRSTEEVMETEGSLELIIGPMFSGKSTAAILKLSRMADVGISVLYINHSDDKRDTESQDGVVTSHSSQYSKLSKKIDSVIVSELKSVDVSKYEYIGIDEGQFFPDLYESVLTWVTGYTKHVIVASLDGDAYRRKFGQVLDLVPNANKVKKLTAYCDICRRNGRGLRPAPFTGRLSDVTTAKVVGGKDLYRAMCRECHDGHLFTTAL